jgi:hypothetical protein
MAGEFTLDQSVRNLGEQSRPVAGAVCGAGTSMVESLQALDGESGQPVCGDPVERGNETDATCIVLKTRIDQRTGHKPPKWERSIVNGTEAGPKTTRS